MNKYLPYLITGIVAGLIVKQMDNKSGVDTTAKRPEQDDASSWWKFW